MISYVVRVILNSIIYNRKLMRFNPSKVVTPLI